MSLAIRISPLFTVFNREYDKSFDSFLPLSNKVVKDVLIEGYKTNSRMATPPMLDETSFHHNVPLKNYEIEIFHFHLLRCQPKADCLFTISYWVISIHSIIGYEIHHTDFFGGFFAIQ